MNATVLHIWFLLKQFTTPGICQNDDWNGIGANWVRHRGYYVLRNFVCTSASRRHVPIRPTIGSPDHWGKRKFVGTRGTNAAVLSRAIFPQWQLAQFRSIKKQFCQQSSCFVWNCRHAPRLVTEAANHPASFKVPLRLQEWAATESPPSKQQSSAVATCLSTRWVWKLAITLFPLATYALTRAPAKAMFNAKRGLSVFVNWHSSGEHWRKIDWLVLPTMLELSFRQGIKAVSFFLCSIFFS